MLQNHFLKDNNLGNIFDETFFTGICFSLEILIENHNKKYNYALFWLIFVEIFLLLQNHFLKNSNLGKMFKKIFDGICFYWNMFLFRNTDRKSYYKVQFSNILINNIGRIFYCCKIISSKIVCYLGKNFHKNFCLKFFLLECVSL